ncbi:MAG: HD domain-containing protein [Vallitaleaceae bacterium]|nr:HD domain-containing protein [Vallitaleaceae bacterium]
MTTKDSYGIVQHNINVSRLSEAYARELRLSEEQCQVIAVAGVFLDLGKIAMDFKVFTKLGTLTEEEFFYIKQHASKSTQLLIQSNLISKDILSCIIHHHESYDGSGYPSKVKGETIPLGARILKICDVYLALLEARTYRDHYSHMDAINIMLDEKQIYDPELIDKFIPFINKYESDKRKKG